MGDGSLRHATKKNHNKMLESISRLFDGKSSWVPFKIVKEANPIKTAEFAIARKFDSESVFVWLVSPSIISKRKNLIKK